MQWTHLMEGNTTVEKSEFKWQNMPDPNHHGEEADQGRGLGRETEEEDQPLAEAGRGQGVPRDLGGIAGVRAVPGGPGQDPAPKVVHETEARKRNTAEARVGPGQDKVAPNPSLEKMILKQRAKAGLEKTVGPGPSQGPDPDREVSLKD